MPEEEFEVQPKLGWPEWCRNRRQSGDEPYRKTLPSLRAPFWFNILDILRNLRASLANKEEKDP